MRGRVGIKNYWSEEADFGLTLKSREKSLPEVFGDKGVGVEKKKILAAGDFSGAIITATKTVIVVTSDKSVGEIFR